MMCRSNGISAHATKGKQKLEKTHMDILRPEFRLNGHLYLPAWKKVEPNRLNRWAKGGSILPSVEVLAAKALSGDKNGADTHMAGEIATIYVV